MKILIVVDMQNDFIDGALGTPEALAIVPNVKKKIEEAVKNNQPIVFTQDTHFDRYMSTQEGKKLSVIHCVKDTEGWQIREELEKLVDGYAHGLILEKYTFGRYDLPEWIDYEYIEDLDGEESAIEIELVGLCTDICVVSNALLLKAYFLDAEISVDANCCAGVTPESHEAALKTMEMCQINIKR